MKRKKWSELEEQTLLSKYSDLLNSGALAKLKTREKKFKPIADHVNSLHHLQDPISYPFKWSWRDVSIKVQNMRHQYLGVKQKIRISNNEFNWDDGEIHWENFLKYKEVFGDIELSDCVKENTNNNSRQMNGNNDGNNKKLGDEGISDILGEGGMMGLGYGMDGEDMEDEEEDEGDEEEDADRGVEELRGGEGAKEENEDLGFEGERKLKKRLKGKRLSIVGAKVLELREVISRREDKWRECEWSRDERLMENEKAQKEREMQREKRLIEREEEIDEKEMELEERQLMWAKRELEKRMRLERELDQGKRRRMKLEEKWEEEEVEWRERMVEMQIEHEKQMMQMHADACQNQLQVLGVMARLVCQFFGSMNDGLGGGLGTLPPQVLQNLQHPGALGDNGKPDATSPSQFL